ncbi:MAG: SGNH/GDSL hydrolase family protein, partial [Pseudomonadales bacterium]|nr:SGNH/GDSL hydrolase family protein [Pseudomonadales bacterium]
APADLTRRTLKLYLGVNSATGQLTASLSDGSLPDETITLTQAWKRSRTVTIDYKANSPGQTLTLTWVKSGNVCWKNPCRTGWISYDAAAMAGPPELPYAEDFNTGLAPGWTVVDDSGTTSFWSAAGNDYEQSNFVGFHHAAMQGGYNKGTYAYLTSGFNLTDYAFSVSATPLAESGLDIGVMVRLSRVLEDYLRLSFSTGSGAGRLESRENGDFVTLAKDARGLPKDVSASLKVEVQGPVVLASVNGEKRFAAYAPAHSYGTVGLYCREHCSFDDVLIEENTSLPRVAIVTPTAYSVQPGTTFEVRAVVLNRLPGSSVQFSIDGVTNACTAATEPNVGLFVASCTVPGMDSYDLVATFEDVSSAVLDTDTNVSVSVGTNVATVGDSVTSGLDDNTATDGVSAGGRVVASQGYQPILTDLLNVGPTPAIVFNNGVPGDSSAGLLNSRIADVLERHADATTIVVLIGVNDAGGASFTPSGLGCSGAACSGTFKGNVQAIVDQAVAAGKIPLVVLTPPRFGDTRQLPYTNPVTHARNLLIRDEYNVVIATELSGHQVGPDLFDFFLGSQNRFDLYATNLHPNALGYAAIAHLISNHFTGGSTPPNVSDNVCVRITTGGACLTESAYKQNLLEVGDTVFGDEVYTLTSVPSGFEDARWITTVNADRDQANGDYLSMELPGTSTVYVAYDAAASSLPAWLDTPNFVDSGMQITTTNPVAATLKLYAKSNASSTVTFGGAAASANGANANYLIAVVSD